jgi:hypothetical protein
MSRLLASCLIAVLLVDPITHSAANRNKSQSSDSQRFLDNAPVVTITNLDVLAGDAFQRDRDNKSLEIDSLLYESKSDQPTINVSREQFYQLFQQQKENNASMQSRLGVFNSSRKLIGAFADLGGPVGIFAFTAGDTYLDHFKDKLQSEMEYSYRGLSEQYFAGRTLNVDRLRTAQAAGTSAFVKEMENQAGLSDAFDDLPQEQRDAAILRLGEFTLASEALQGQEFHAAQNANKAEFNRLKHRIAHIEDCQHTIASGMSNLMEQTYANTQELEGLSTQLNRQNKDLGLIQQVMFGHLSVDEQLELVKNSSALGLTEEEKQSLVSNLEKRKVLVEEVHKWNEFVHTGNDLIGIAAKLGVDKDIVQTLQKGLSAGDTAYGAINAALSGNYLGAVTAVFGLFGGGGMDAETAHYAAIMAKLDEIIETQKKIIVIQQKILDELHQIESLIISNQIELRGILANIFALQAATLDAVTQIKKADLNYCTKFLDDRYSEDAFMKDENRFRDYDSMRRYFANNWQTYDLCRRALDQSIANISGVHGIFFGYPELQAEATRIQITSLPQVFESVQYSVAPFFAYLKLYAPDTDRDKKTIVGSFFAPSLNFRDLQTKQNIIATNATAKAAVKSVDVGVAQGAAADPNNSSQTASSPVTMLQTLRPISALNYPSDNQAVAMFYSSFSTELLSPDAVVYYADVETQVNNWRELTSKDGNTLLTSSEIYQGLGNKTKAEIALKAAFDWLTLAIAQQNFLDGDTLLPVFSSDGFSEYTAPQLSLRQLIAQPASENIAHDQEVALAHYLIGHNPVLAENVIRYRIFKQMSADVGTKLTAFGYGWGYTHHESPIFLQTLLKDNLSIEYVEHKDTDGPAVPPTGWYTKYSFTDYSDAAPQPQSVMVPLPPIEEVAEQSFVTSSALQKLMLCRNKINALLAADQVIAESDKQPNEFKTLKLMLLTQRYKPLGAVPIQRNARRILVWGLVVLCVLLVVVFSLRKDATTRLRNLLRT